MTSPLFDPIRLRGLTLENRIMVSPMCQYSAVDGSMTDWHFAHLGMLANSGAALLCFEMTDVEPIGRITPGCSGLYSDANEAALRPIVAFCRMHGQAKLAIQLAHAGRKASTAAPWDARKSLRPEEGGWQPVAPSEIPMGDGELVPRALTRAEIQLLVAKFADSTRRAERIGFDAIELHSAHGYLMHEFLSPLSNRREDEYGGSLANRMRFPLEVFAAVRAAWPEGKPLGVRISCTDWIEGGWDLEQSVVFARELKKLGCDWIDCSSGGLMKNQVIPVGPGYQVPFAERIREDAGIVTIAIGLITEAGQAEKIVAGGKADMVALARGFLWNPRWAWTTRRQVAENHMGARKNPIKPKDRNEESQRWEERFQNLAELSSEWYWEQDEDCRFTLMTGSAAGHGGLDPKNVLGTFRWDRGAVPVGDGGSWDKHKAVLKARQPFSDLLYRRASPTGELRTISTSGQPVFDDKGRFRGYRGIAKDVTKSRRAEQLLALEHAVSRRLAEAESTAGALKAVIRAVCETEDWECGRYFRVDEKAGLLRFAEGWSVPGDAIERFIAGSRDVTYAPGAGLAGLAWRTEQPVWSSDIATDPRVAQVKLARDTGMHGAFLFPVVSEGKVVGVFTFNSRQIRDPDERLLQAIRVIGNQIGQFVKRKQAEDVVRESEERFRSLTELSSDMYWTQDSEHRFTTFSGSNKTLPLRLIGKHRWDEKAFNMTEADWGAHKATMDARQPFRDVELGRMSATGETFWVSISGAPVFDDSGKFIGYRGLSKNITERKRAEQLRALEHAVSRGLADADNAQVGLKAAIRAVCETEDWECGRYFRVDEKAGVLRFADAWGVPDPAVERFIETSHALTYRPGVGLSGLVWQSGKPLWSADISKDPRSSSGSSRTDSSREIGMHGTFVFPVVSDGKTIGVLSFADRKARQPEEQLLQAVHVIG